MDIAINSEILQLSIQKLHLRRRHQCPLRRIPVAASAPSWFLPTVTARPTDLEDPLEAAQPHDLILEMLCVLVLFHSHCPFLITCLHS